MSENNNGYTTTAGVQSFTDAPSPADNPKAPRPRRKHSNVRQFLNQLIAVVICVAIIWGGGIAFWDGCRLGFISDEIDSMGLIPAEKDDPKNIRYNELLDERVEIRDSSWIGYLLVQAGRHWVTKIIRMVALFAITILVIPCAFYFIGYIICVDIKFILKKIARRLGFKPKTKKRNGGNRTHKNMERRQRQTAQRKKARKGDSKKNFAKA